MAKTALQPELKYPQTFEFPQRKKYRGLETASAIVIDELLSNTDRKVLRRLAENGGPLALIQEGLLAYASAVRYAVADLDLRNPADLERGIRLQEEERAVRWQIDFWERMLSPLPEDETATQTAGEV